MALLVVSQGMARIGVLEMVTRYILRISFGKLWLAALIALLAGDMLLVPGKTIPSIDAAILYVLSIVLTPL